MVFSICRFRIVQHDTSRGDVGPDQPTDARTGYAAPRVSSNVLRVVRDTALGPHVKSLYAYRCQVCGIRLECEGGPYAEAAHVRPLGRPHDGPDELSNVLCLCPNHHVLFDNGAFSIADDLSLIGLSGGLTSSHQHALDPAPTSPTTVGSVPALEAESLETTTGSPMSEYKKRRGSYRNSRGVRLSSLRNLRDRRPTAPCRG